jgi:protein Tex
MFAEKISRESGISLKQVKNTLDLLATGATIPFISRYRKEVTGSLDEVQVASIRDLNKKLEELEKRRQAILESIEEQGLLTEELKNKILKVDVLSELEDIYLPYKPKKKTRATIAKAKGLEPLAKKIMAQHRIDVEFEAAKFVDEELGVNSEEEALAGARDIVAEWVSEDAQVRSRLRNLFKRSALLKSKVVKKKEEEGEKYKNYFEWEEPVMKSPSHRILAMFRGETESFLRLKIEPLQEDSLDRIEPMFVKSNNECTPYVKMAVADSYKRLIAPSMENEIRAVIKEKADLEAIRVFAENLRQLLLASPMGPKTILAIDPGFRTGCKIVCLDRQGNLLHNETIFPHPPQKETKQAFNKISSLVDAYKIEAIAIGNGTAGRETENLIRRMKFKKEVLAVMVNENGASVYSASKVARDEFPDYDITVRGAVSIGRRLMDPLAELVKIDPKSIGVGQYQHDVNQGLLQQSLQETVESCVNKVGVELNTASKELLQYVSGLGPVLAQNIIEYRKENGAFKSRKELKKVKRFGEKAFEQSAGFLRIRSAENPLDNSAVHPESYAVVQRMAKAMKTDVMGLIRDDDGRKKLDLNAFVSGNTGLPTLKDIMRELDKPGRDPREEFDVFEFDQNVNAIGDLEVGMVLPGIVTNITAFGAFVDLGVHQDGLVHLSQMADQFVRDPNEYVKINQKLRVKVLEVDKQRKRIQLSMKGMED